MTGGEAAHDDPAAEYARRLRARQDVAAQLARADHRLGDVRLAVVIIILLAAYLALGRRAFSPAWLAPPVVLFVGLLIRHEQVVKRKQRAQRATRFYESGIARLENRWAGTGNTGAPFAGFNGYAADLDLFGRGSLFELLCTARTRQGEQRLAGWLQATEPLPDVLRARQTAVQELRPRLDLREEIALLGHDVRAAAARATAGSDPDAELLSWAGAPPVVFPRWAPPVAGLIALATFGAALAWTLNVPGAAPVFGAFVFAGQGFAAVFRKRMRAALRGVERAGTDLGIYARLLARIETEAFTAPRLVVLQSRLTTGAGAAKASQSIARLDTLIGWLQARQNQVFALVAALLLWELHFAVVIERWRAAHNASVLRAWLETVGEIEALLALAGYAYEHPADPFPEIVSAAETGHAAAGVCFEGTALGHPLLPEHAVVRNDLCLDASRRLYLVSGSNMSGKSTFLRTVGVNAVLALAGAPVRATHLKIAPLLLGASLRTQDSLQGGVSRFYAEVLRLRDIVEQAAGAGENDGPPLLFLLDEILHGTNSHDRRVGAEAILRALLRRNASGLATTHDLALTAIVDGAAFLPGGVNVHFEDQMSEGKMTFDYLLRPGVVEKSNAIALMRAVGLEV